MSAPTQMQRTPSGTTTDGSLKGKTDAEAAPSPPPAPAKPPRVSFWHPSIAMKRKMYIRLYSKYVGYLILLMWAFYPIYLAAHTTPNSKSRNLSVWVVDRDQSIIGNGVRAAVSDALNGAQGLVLGYDYRGTNNASVATDADVEYAVVEEHTYAAIVVNENATNNLMSYMAGNNPDYNPRETPAITLWWNEARNQFASDLYVIPLASPMIAAASGATAASITSQFLQSNSGNQTALTHFAQAAAQIATNSALQGGLVSYEMVNLRPYYATNVMAVTSVGFVLVLIFAFVLTMSNAMMRMIVAPHLTIKSYILLRVCAPLLAYIPLSLSFCTVSLAFHVPWDGKYTMAQGFGLYWIITYLMMCSLGLATEFAIYLVTPKFAPFMMIILILTNINLIEYPIEMLPGIEKYGRAWPFYQGLQAITTITFDTKSHLRQNVPILLAWTILNIITISVSTGFMEWRARRKQA